MIDTLTNFTDLFLIAASVSAGWYTAKWVVQFLLGFLSAFLREMAS